MFITVSPYSCYLHSSTACHPQASINLLSSLASALTWFWLHMKIQALPKVKTTLWGNMNICTEFLDDPSCWDIWLKTNKCHKDVQGKIRGSTGDLEYLYQISWPSIQKWLRYGPTWTTGSSVSFNVSHASAFMLYSDTWLVQFEYKLILLTCLRALWPRASIKVLKWNE